LKVNNQYYKIQKCFKDKIKKINLIFEEIEYIIKTDK